MRRALIVTPLLLVSATPAEAQWRIAPDIDIGAAGRPAAVAVGDFDNDGRQDLAIADPVSGRHFIHVRLGNGDGSFREGSRFGSALVLFPEDLAVGDFHADGNEDLGIAAGGATLARAFGRGDGKLDHGGSSSVPGAARSLAVGDFNGDGASDLAVAAGEKVALRVSVGADGTPTGHDIALGAPVRSVATGDFDGDAREDVAAVVNGDPAHLELLTSEADFAGGGKFPLGGAGAGLAVGDFDGDAREDVVVAIPGRDRVAVRLGTGAAPDVAVGGGPEAVAVADIDADGRQDLVVANASSDSVSVRLGEGDGRFRSGGELAAGDSPSDIAVADFDADGRQDLAIANRAAGTVSVRLGDVPLAGNLLMNGGFDQGRGSRLPGEALNIPGWTTTGGMTFTRYGAHPHFGVPTWLDAPRHGGGLNFVSGGDSAGYGGVTEAAQTVLVTDAAEAIDGGRATVSLSADLGGGLAFPDTMTATAEFLDVDGTALGVLQVGPVTAAERRNLTTLLRRAGSAPVPVRTRRIRVTLTSRDNDRWSSAIADNVRLTLATTPPAAPPASAAFGADTKVRLALAARRAPLRVRVRNANDFAVTGWLATRRFTVAAGGRTTVRLPLRKAQRRRLQRKGRVALRLSAVVADPAGNRRTVVKRVSLRRR